VAAGGSAPISLTVTETGTGSLGNGNVELQIFNSAGSAVATQVWSAQNFPAGKSLPYSYTWTPAATLAPGTYSVDLGVFDSGWTKNYYWNTDATINVTAPSSGTPAVSLSSTSLTFASQNVGTASGAQPVTLTNSGTGSLAISGISIGGVNATDFTKTTTCGASLAAGAQCSISVTFKPTAGGSRSATVAITDNAAGSPHSILLSGVGVAVPAVSLSSTALSLGNQNVGTTSGTKSVTLTNSGTGPLTIAGIAVGGVNPSDFARTTTCGASVAAGAHCTISVTFKPTATGARSAAIVITDNAAGSPRSIALSGNGTTRRSR
jgi:hypothetical protein